MEENNDKKVDVSEESEKRIAKAVSKEMRKFSFRDLGIKDILMIVIVIAVIIAGVSAYNNIKKSFTTMQDGLSSLVTFDNGAEEHDLVLENDGILGYTAADFEEAILGDGKQLKKIEVYSQDVSDVVTLVDTGLFNWSALTKTQVITYNGHVTYTVDMTSIDSSNIIFDEETKTITLKIPHAVQEEINIPEDEIEYADPEKGLLAFGDIETTPEEISKVQKEARNKMKQKLKSDNVLETADRFAKLTVWEIYSPIIKGVAKDYSLEVEFVD